MSSKLVSLQISTLSVLSVLCLMFLHACSSISRSVADHNGHGTFVAGTAVGAYHGVARGATLHAVKVLHDDGKAPISNIINGLDW